MLEHRRKQYARAVAALCGLGVIAEIVRLVEPWPGYAPSASRLVSVLLIGLWSLTAAAFSLRERHRWIAKLAWGLAFASPMSMLLHASVTRVGGSVIGLSYFVAAAALAYFAKRAIARRPALGGAPARDAGPSSSPA